MRRSLQETKNAKPREPTETNKTKKHQTNKKGGKPPTPTRTTGNEFCCLVPLARTSYSVRGVGCSRPEPAALQRVTLARSSGTLCWTVWGAREQQKPAHMDREFFLGSAVNQLAHSSGEWCLFWISTLTHCFCYVAMDCRYFAKTKTLWEHLNNSAEIFQLGASETMHVLMMSLQLR